MSTGLPTLAAAGRNERSSARVASLERRELEPVRLAGVGGEDARTAGVREDRHSCRRAAPADATSSAATSNSSSSRSVRMTPACRNSASTTVSLDASAPVCEAAARDPAVERPALTATIGFVRADAPSDLAELLRVPEALEIEQDDGRPRIVGPVPESDRCPTRPPCCPPRRSSRCRCRAASRSRGSPGPARRSASTSRRSRRRVHRGEGRVQAHGRVGVEQAHAVGPDQPAPRLPNAVEQDGFARASLGVAFAEPGADDADRAGRAC